MTILTVLINVHLKTLTVLIKASEEDYHMVVTIGRHHWQDPFICEIIDKNRENSCMSVRLKKKGNPWMILMKRGGGSV